MKKTAIWKGFWDRGWAWRDSVWSPPLPPPMLLSGLRRLHGRVAVWELSKGFGLATQEPWIQFATIRDNILFGKTFDAQLYKEVLEACALNDDLSVSTWP